ncbi:MAG: 50S ribosomal protein L29 [Leptonema sp. (in: bacteria)]
MPKQNIRNLSTEELQAQLKQKKQELIQLRFQLGANKMIQKPSEIKKLKKDIARIYTILTEKKMNRTGGTYGRK